MVKGCTSRTATLMVYAYAPKEARPVNVGADGNIIAPPTDAVAFPKRSPKD